MEMIYLDGRMLTCTEEGHNYIQHMLGFPDYYGKNLDALYDLLTEISMNVEISISYSNEMDKMIKKVFLNASNENECVNIILTK